MRITTNDCHLCLSGRSLSHVASAPLRIAGHRTCCRVFSPLYSAGVQPACSNWLNFISLLAAAVLSLYLNARHRIIRSTGAAFDEGSRDSGHDRAKRSFADRISMRNANFSRNLVNDAGESMVSDGILQNGYLLVSPLLVYVVRQFVLMNGPVILREMRI